MQGRTYVIAEIGKACNGDLARCRRLLDACAGAGADAVRFHHFTLEQSVHADALAPSTERAWSFALHLPFLEESLFSAGDYRTIVDLCRERGLDLIGTPWDLPALALCRDAGIARYKVNSLNAFNVPLVSAIVDGGAPLYLATGGLLESQVRELCQHLALAEHDVVLMHAVSAYPAPPTVINMRALDVLRRHHPRVGYSSNDRSPVAALAACALGAEALDLHVHLDDRDPGLHKASISAARLAELVSETRELETILGRPIKQESRGEMVNHDLMAKGLVLRRDVPRGEPVTADSVTLQLPPRGISARRWYHVVGATSTADLHAGRHLFSSDVDGDRGPASFDRERTFLPGQVGVVVRPKDIEEMVAGRDVDYAEVHYAAKDVDRPDVLAEHDLGLVVHLPEYSDGILLDLCSYTESVRQFSIQVIDRVMAKARAIRPRFRRSPERVKFIVHPGAATYPDPLDDPGRQPDLFLDSLRRMDTEGLEILVENMTPYPWFLDGDWSPKQGVSNSFMDPVALAEFLGANGYGMCLDLCHAKLYCNWVGIGLRAYMTAVKPFVRHIHFSDCTGVDGEGLQVGEGEIDWQEVCEAFGDYRHGWTPEIWNGHHDHGAHFYEAHALLGREFRRYRERQAHAPAAR